ncbi:hypothetical protein ACWDLG_38395 [Nonomuraea sp. NPDC003727]
MSPAVARPTRHSGRTGRAAVVRALEALLVRLDPERVWGGLSRMTTPEGLTLYLCADHSRAYRRPSRSALEGSAPS